MVIHQEGVDMLPISNGRTEKYDEVKSHLSQFCERVTRTI